MRYYEIQLPARDNAGNGTAKAIAAFESATLRLIGGMTKRSAGNGVWQGQGGKVFRDVMIPFRLACTEQQFATLLLTAFNLFPDQEAIFTADLGTAEIVQRPKAIQIAA